MLWLVTEMISYSPKFEKFKKCATICSKRLITLSISRSRSLYWERGLKCHNTYGISTSHRRRSLYWERGLKFKRKPLPNFKYRSLSVLRAWIEILHTEVLTFENGVALCIESVDWNIVFFYLYLDSIGRSLYWERGLKYDGEDSNLKELLSLSVLRAWIEITNSRN